MQKILMIMGAAAAMASPLVSAQAAMPGQVLPTVSPVGATTLNTAPASEVSAKALVPMARVSAPPADFSIENFGTSVPDLSPAQVNDSLFAFPAAAPAKVFDAEKSVFGFDGLSHYDQLYAGTGVYVNTQFSKEPPDQALAVGNGYVVEAVNDALAVYRKNGKRVTAPMPMTQFFGLPPAYNYGTKTYGSVSLSDVRAYYDAPTGRFFIEEWGTGMDPNTGAATGTSAIYLAVSRTSNPAKGYTLYTFDTTFDPNVPGINILPDYVQIGADANGFYLSFNQFDLLGLLPPDQGFLGPRILALSKADLAAGTSTPVVSFSRGDLYNSPAGFTVQPAKTPAGGAYETKAGGTEYFLSTVFDTTANQLGVWAISNTSSLNSNAPSLTLSDTLINCLPFSSPSPAIQKTGSYPLGMSLGYPEELLDSGDQRMTQVTYVQGHLYSAVETSFPDAAGNVPDGTDSGFLYFSAAPSVDAAGNVSGQISRQGYARVAGETLSYPSFGISNTGGAVITCALVGPDFFPSAAYVPLDSHLKATSLNISSLGVAPDDGFTGYPTDDSGNPITDDNGNPVQGIARWGDYSQAQATEDGSIWLAQELISAKSNTQRSKNANYGTFIAKITPSSSFRYGGN